jgi:hypothetical protein
MTKITVHRIEFGLAPNSPPYRAWVTVNGKNYSTEGYGAMDVWNKCYRSIPDGERHNVDTRQYYNTEAMFAESLDEVMPT